MKIDQFLNKLPLFKQRDIYLEKIIEQAEVQAKEIILKAREEALKLEREAEISVKRTTQDVIQLEKQLTARQEEIKHLEKKLNFDKVQIERERKIITEKKDEILQKLNRVSSLNAQEARELVLHSWEDKLKGELASRIRTAEEDIKNKIDEKARELLVDAMQHGAVDYIAEYTLSSITLPNEDFKGRIIGKEGRNIRAFEIATGVDVDLEEEGVIKLSSFDAVRREIAKVSMERLITDGRIQPSRIEEIVTKTKQDIDKIIIKAGEELCHKVGVYNLPFDLIKLLGRFKYRYSYGQNMIQHTLEETKIGIAIAHELKAEVNIVKLGCLLHDIGKVVTDKEGSHVQLGVELLQKHKIPQKVIDTVESHHEDTSFKSTEAIIVYIADAVSGGRPGARHEDLELYIKRIKTLEEIAKSNKGVVDAYALQAGRELRVIVNPVDMTDDETTILANNIKEEVEKQFPTFPGQVNITIIRETRAFATSHS